MDKIRIANISHSDYIFNLTKMLNAFFSECHVRTQSELLNFFKSRSDQNHICMKQITKQDNAYTFPSYMKEVDAIICESCYKDVLEKFPKIAFAKRNKGIGFCDCGNDSDIDPKVFCHKHQGGLKTKEQLDEYLVNYFKDELVNIPQYLSMIIHMLDFLVLQYEIKCMKERTMIKQDKDQRNAYRNVMIDDYSDHSSFDKDEEDDDNKSKSYQSYSINEASIDDDGDNEGIIEDFFIENDQYEIEDFNFSQGNQNLLTIKSYEEITNNNIDSLTKYDLIIQIKDIASLLSDFCSQTFNLGLCMLIGKLLSSSQNNMTKHRCIITTSYEIPVTSTSDKDYHLCTCSPVQNILIAFNNDTTIDHNLLNYFRNLFFYTLKSNDFKFSITLLSLIRYDSFIFSLIQQDLLSPNILYNNEDLILKLFNHSPQCLSIFFTCFKMLLRNKSNWKPSITTYVLEAVTSILRHNSRLGFISNCIDIMKKIIECMEIIQNEVVFIKEEDNDHRIVDEEREEDALSTELDLLRIFSLFVFYFDYTKQKDSYEMLCFIISKIMTVVNPLDNVQYTFSIPLQRALSIFANRYIIHDSFQQENTNGKGNVYIEIIKDLFENNNQINSIDTFINDYLLIPLCKTIHFIHGTQHNLWSLYTEKLRVISSQYFDHDDLFYLSDLHLLKWIFLYKSVHKQTMYLIDLLNCFTPIPQDITNIFDTMPEADSLTYINDLEFIFKCWKNEDFIFDLLISPFCLLGTNTTNIDSLYEKVIEYNKTDFETNLLLRINKIIIANDNLCELRHIIYALPLYWNNKQKDVIRILQSHPELITMSSDGNKLCYLSKKPMQTDTFELFISSMISRTKRYLIDNQLPLIKSVKTNHYTYINCKDDSIITERNLRYMIELLCSVIGTEKTMNEAICVIMKIAVILSKEFGLCGNSSIIEQFLQSIQEAHLEEKLIEGKYDEIIRISFDYLMKVVRGIIDNDSKKKVLSNKAFNEIGKCFICQKILEKNYKVGQLGFIGFLVKDGYNYYTKLSNIITVHKLIYCSTNADDNDKLRDYNESLPKYLIEYSSNRKDNKETIRFISCSHRIHYTCYYNITRNKNNKTYFSCDHCSTINNIFVPRISYQNIPGTDFTTVFNIFKDNNLNVDSLFKRIENPSTYSSSEGFLLKVLSIESSIEINNIQVYNNNLLEKYTESFINTFISLIELIDSFGHDQSSNNYEFLRSLILSIRVEIIKQSFSISWFLKEYLKLLLKIEETYTNEDEIVHMIESNELMKTFYRLLFHSLILFDNKENELGLAMIKIFPIILFQCYVYVYYKLNHGKIDPNKLKEDFSYESIELFYKEKENKNVIEKYAMIYWERLYIAKIILDGNNIKDHNDINNVTKELKNINQYFDKNNFLSFLTMTFDDKIKHDLFGNSAKFFNNIRINYAKEKGEKNNAKGNYYIPVNLLSFISNEPFKLVCLPEKIDINQFKEKEIICLICGSSFSSLQNSCLKHVILCYKGTGIFLNISQRKTLYYLNNQLKEVPSFPYINTNTEGILSLSPLLLSNLNKEYQTLTMTKHFELQSLL